LASGGAAKRDVARRVYAPCSWLESGFVFSNRQYDRDALCVAHGGQSHEMVSVRQGFLDRVCEGVSGPRDDLLVANRGRGVHGPDEGGEVRRLPSAAREDESPQVLGGERVVLQMESTDLRRRA